MSEPKRMVLVAMRILMGALLIYAAWNKLRDGAIFLRSLEQYKLPLPIDVLKVVAVWLPGFEMVCGVMLVTGVWLEVVVPLSTLLFFCFVVVLGQSIIRGQQIDCGCFGFSSEPGFIDDSRIAFVRACILFALGIIIFRVGSGRPVRVEKNSS